MGLGNERVADEDYPDAEKIVVDAHLRALYSQLAAYEYVNDTTAFYEDWEDVIPVVFKRDFNFPYARDWWLRERALEKYWTTDLDRMLDDYFGVEAE